MVIGTLVTASAMTLFWILATWWVGLPLIFLPVAMAAGVGLVAGSLSETPRQPQAFFAAGVSLVHCVVGSIFSTILLALPPGKSSLTHAWSYLKDPARFRDIVLRTQTPSDVLVYSFIAGASYAMVRYVAWGKAAKKIPAGHPVEAAE
jgi:hypothetical protein